MALAAAHGLIGATIIGVLWPERDPLTIWKPMLVGAAVGIFPDLDFVLTWFLDFSSNWHRGFSHSIVFAYLLGWCASLCCGRRDVKSALIFGTAAATHGILDVLVSTKGGVELLWPFFSRRFVSGLYEYPDFFEVRLYLQNDLLVIKGPWRLIQYSLKEILICSPLLLLSILYRRILKQIGTKSIGLASLDSAMDREGRI